MRKVIVSLLAVLMLVDNATLIAGVNCERQHRALESTVCSDSGLKHLSDDLDFYYQGALRVTGNVAAVEHSQAEWQSKSEQCEQQQDFRKCLRTSYQNRLSDIKSYAEAFRGYAGYAFKTVNLSDGNIGLEIERIEPNSPAQSAGLQLGDVIIKTGAGSIRSLDDIVRINFPVVNLAEPITVLRDEDVFVTQIITRSAFRSFKEFPEDIRDRVEGKPVSIHGDSNESNSYVAWIGGGLFLLFVGFIFIKRLKDKEAVEENGNRRSSSQSASSSSGNAEPDDKSDDYERYAGFEKSFDSYNEQVPVDEFSDEYIQEFWYKILGVSNTATQAEIKAGYKSTIRMYHPDKVANFPDEFQVTADKCSKRINAAYQYIRKHKGF